MTYTIGAHPRPTSPTCPNLRDEPVYQKGREAKRLRPNADPANVCPYTDPRWVRLFVQGFADEASLIYAGAKP